MAEYRSRKDNQPKPSIDEILAEWNLKVDDCQSRYYDGKELTRIAVIKNA